MAGGLFNVRSGTFVLGNDTVVAELRSKPRRLDDEYKQAMIAAQKVLKESIQQAAREVPSKRIPDAVFTPNFRKVPDPEHGGIAIVGDVQIDTEPGPGGAPHALFVDQGTGIFGPTGQRIFATKGHPFAIPLPSNRTNTFGQPRSGFGEVPAFSGAIKGMPARPFFDKGVERARPLIDEIFDRAGFRLAERL